MSAETDRSRFNNQLIFPVGKTSAVSSQSRGVIVPFPATIADETDYSRLIVAGEVQKPDTIGRTEATNMPKEARPAKAVKVEASGERPLTVRELRRSGLIGLWGDRTDISDSADYARYLRRKAETRDWD